MNFESVELGNYIKVQGGYAYKSNDFNDDGDFPVIKIKNVRFGDIDYSEASHISNELAMETADWKTKEGDILISMTGSGPNAPNSLVGRVARIWEGEPDAWINQRVGRILLNGEKEIHPDFIYYLLSSSDIQHYLVSNSTGSANQANISGKLIESVPCPEVDFETSKRIASQLKGLDQKIRLNQQTNKTLEATAQAIFKSWFVDFDPVRAKIAAKKAGRDSEKAAMAAIAGVSLPSFAEASEGRGWDDIEAALQQKLNRMTPEQATQLRHTASLFPDELVESELGEVPKGWGVTDLTKCLDRISKTYNLKEVEELIFLNTGDIENGRFLHKNYSKTNGLPGQAKKSIQEGDILYSEIRPKNKRFAYVYFDSSNYVVSTKLMVLRSKNSIDSLFYYQILKSESTVKELQFLAESRSGTFPQITFDSLKAIKFILPNQKEILDHYTTFLNRNFKRSIQNQKQNETLTQIRDTLLPKLISGAVGLKQNLNLSEVYNE